MQNSESEYSAVCYWGPLGWAGNGPVYTSHLSTLISPPQGTGCHLFTLRPSSGWREHSVKYSIIIFMVNSIWRGMMLIRQPPAPDRLPPNCNVCQSEMWGLPVSGLFIFNSPILSIYLSAGSAEEDALLPLLCKMTRPVWAAVWLRPLSTSGPRLNFLTETEEEVKECGGATFLTLIVGLLRNVMTTLLHLSPLWYTNISPFCHLICS